MNGALSGHQNQSGRFAEDINPLSFPETAPRFFRHQPIDLSLYQVRYPGCLLASTSHIPMHATRSVLPVLNEAIALVISALFVCFWRDSTPVGHGLIIHEVSRSHPNDAPQSVGLL